MVALSLSAQPQRAPRLRLLLEQEPAYRVFLRNLADLVFSRTPLPIAVTSTPATSWDDVFVPSSVPWRRFVESLLGHMIVVTALLILIPKWPSEPIERPRVFDKSYVSYYTPPKSFPALRSHPARPQANRQPVAAHRPTIRVAPEHARRPGEKGGQSQALTLPPDLISSKPDGSSFRLRTQPISHDAPLCHRELAPECAGQPILAGRSALRFRIANSSRVGSAASFRYCPGARGGRSSIAARGCSCCTPFGRDRTAASVAGSMRQARRRQHR
jgi:hypothetical protein